MKKQAPVCLEIYITDKCFGCNEALALAEELRYEFPSVVIELIDLHRVGKRRRAEIFATPTYVLDGETVSLGNPDPKEIRDQLRAAQNMRKKTSVLPN